MDQRTSSAEDSGSESEAKLTDPPCSCLRWGVPGPGLLGAFPPSPPTGPLPASTAGHCRGGGTPVTTCPMWPSSRALGAAPAAGGSSGLLTFGPVLLVCAASLWWCSVP